jgi:Zn finger protein HypA/HybF involved in hydrogenase expression
MKAATVKQIKDELNDRSPKELLEYCLRLSKFKKENKELLTYLLFEASAEESYIQSVKNEMDEQFEEVNCKNFYYVKKGIRKILANVKKHIRYSQNKETEVDLLIYFCKTLKTFSPSIRRSTTMMNLYNRQIEMIRKKIEKLHEDLQYDYGQELENL